MEPSHPFSYLSPLLQSEKIEWTWEENKLFENGLAELNHDSPEFLQQIALKIPGKNIAQIKKHYDALIEDIKLIESDGIPSPKSYFTNNNKGKEQVVLFPVKNEINHQQRKRRRGVLWTPEEHKVFLEGLEKFGKGDWKSISRNCVTNSSRKPCPKLFEKIVPNVRGKTVEEIENHYEALVEDVEKIETGKIPLPEYNPIKAEVVRRNRRTGKKKKETTSSVGKIARRWREEEHKLFMIGYEKHRVWRNMSDEYVKNKTPTQVATRSRRYFDRKNKRSQADTNSIKPIAHSFSFSSSGANPPSNNNNNVTEKSSRGIPENQPTNPHFSGQMPLSCSYININNAETDEDEEDLLDLDKFPSIYD